MLNMANMLPSLYIAVNDTDRTDPIYDDDTLIGLLKDASIIVRSKLDADYSIVKSTEPDELTYYIDPDVNERIQMLIVIKAALLVKTYEVRYSYRTEAFSITRTSKREEIEFLTQEFNDLVNDYHYTIGAAVDEWDRYNSRVNQIISVLSRN